MKSLRLKTSYTASFGAPRWGALTHSCNHIVIPAFAITLQQLTGKDVHILGFSNGVAMAAGMAAGKLIDHQPFEVGILQQIAPL